MGIFEAMATILLIIAIILFGVATVLDRLRSVTGYIALGLVFTALALIVLINGDDPISIGDSALALLR